MSRAAVAGAVLSAQNAKKDTKHSQAGFDSQERMLAMKQALGLPDEAKFDGLFKLDGSTCTGSLLIGDYIAYKCDARDAVQFMFPTEEVVKAEATEDEDGMLIVHKDKKQTQDWILTGFKGAERDKALHMLWKKLKTEHSSLSAKIQEAVEVAVHENMTHLQGSYPTVWTPKFHLDSPEGEHKEHKPLTQQQEREVTARVKEIATKAATIAAVKTQEALVLQVQETRSMVWESLVLLGEAVLLYICTSTLGFFPFRRVSKLRGVGLDMANRIETRIQMIKETLEKQTSGQTPGLVSESDALGPLVDSATFESARAAFAEEETDGGDQKAKSGWHKVGKVFTAPANWVGRKLGKKLLKSTEPKPHDT